MSDINVIVWWDELQIKLEEYNIIVQEEEVNINIITETQWPAWPPWEKWNKGDKGDTWWWWNYEYSQSIPSATWNITHNLWFHPNITVIDTGWSLLIWFWTIYTGNNSLQLSFAGETTWIAYLS